MYNILLGNMPTESTQQFNSLSPVYKRFDKFNHVLIRVTLLNRLNNTQQQVDLGAYDDAFKFATYVPNVKATVAFDKYFSFDYSKVKYHLINLAIKSRYVTFLDTVTGKEYKLPGSRRTRIAAHMMQYNYLLEQGRSTHDYYIWSGLNTLGTEEALQHEDFQRRVGKYIANLNYLTTVAWNTMVEDIMYDRACAELPQPLPVAHEVPEPKGQLQYTPNFIELPYFNKVWSGFKTLGSYKLKQYKDYGFVSESESVQLKQATLWLEEHGIVEPKADQLEDEYQVLSNEYDELVANIKATDEPIVQLRLAKAWIKSGKDARFNELQARFNTKTFTDLSVEAQYRRGFDDFVSVGFELIGSIKLARPEIEVPYAVTVPEKPQYFVVNSGLHKGKRGYIINPHTALCVVAIYDPEQEGFITTKLHSNQLDMIQPKHK